MIMALSILFNDSYSYNSIATCSSEKNFVHSESCHDNLLVHGMNCEQFTIVLSSTMLLHIQDIVMASNDQDFLLWVKMVMMSTLLHDSNGIIVVVFRVCLA